MPRALYNLSKQYGSIFKVHIGENVTVLLGSAELMKEVFVKNAALSSSRFNFTSMWHFSHRLSVISSSGDKHKQLRDIMSPIFTPTRVQKLQKLIIDNSNALADHLAEVSDRGEPVRMDIPICSFGMNIILSVVLSKSLSYDPTKADQETIKVIWMVGEILKSFAVGSLADVFPSLLSICDPTSSEVIDYCRSVDDYIKKNLQEHKSTYEQGSQRDFMDSLIEMSEDEKITEEEVVYCVKDLLFAGTDTSSTTILWAILLLVNHPNVQEKVATEIADLTKGDLSIVTSKLRSETPYLNAVIKEVMRIRSVAPLGLVHVAKENIDLSNGLSIPKNAHIVPFIYGVARNDIPDAEEFIPERYLQSPGDYPQDVLPFGVGARVCLDSTLRVLMVNPSMIPKFTV
eukprot:gene12598-14784_t